MVDNAIKELSINIHPRTMVISDLDCSSGANTLLFIYVAIAAINGNPTNIIKGCPMEVQFFLNDLANNDFNQIFQSLEQFEQLTAEICSLKGLQPPPQYIAGVPGFFYNRLFPCKSVHLFHSSFGLMWLSQVPKHLDGNMNEGNIHIGEITLLSVAKLYQNQFEKDFSWFLQMRCKELVPGGRMVLTVLARKCKDMRDDNALEVLSKALHTFVAKGRVEKKKLDSFNVPMYLPSAEELKQLVQKSELLDITNIHLVSTSWNRIEDDDSESTEEEVTAPVVDGVTAAQAASKSISMSLRAVLESLITSHFGETIVNDLFEEFACNISSHIESEVEKKILTIISIFLRARQ
uniref:Uncharacterized protein n=1 Tax=Oryza meridionalis TaxID=40149 RepID=A0A0E0F4F7_9ORYZ